MILTYRQMQIIDLPAAFAVRLSTVVNAITMEELEDNNGVTPRSLSVAMKACIAVAPYSLGKYERQIAMNTQTSGDIKTKQRRDKNLGSKAYAPPSSIVGGGQYERECSQSRSVYGLPAHNNCSGKKEDWSSSWCRCPCRYG